jgi:hypothetical protein
MKAGKKAYSPFEVSQAYGIPEGTLANLRMKKQGPRYFRVGRRVLYLSEDLEAWIKANPVQTNEVNRAE